MAINAGTDWAFWGDIFFFPSKDKQPFPLSIIVCLPLPSSGYTHTYLPLGYIYRVDMRCFK